MSGAIGELGIGVGGIGVGSTPSRPAAPLSPPPTRILSWSMMVREADPDFDTTSMRPWGYIFSNGRKFYDPVPLYGDPFLRDDFGTIMVDDFGNPIRTDAGGGTAGGFVFGTGVFGTDTF